jgi:transposase
MVTIGIDPHKASLTLVAINATGEPVKRARIACDGHLIDNVLAFAADFPTRTWAVEGASGLGLGITQLLVRTGEHVLDVPASLAARARVLSTGHGRKTDATDAYSVALVGQQRRGLRQAQPEDPTVAMKLLVDHRTDLVTQRTQTVNRIHKLLRELVPGGAKTQLSTRQAGTAVKAVRAVTATDKLRLRIARDLLAGLRQLDARIATATGELEALVAQCGTTLTDIPGCGAIMAATLLGYTGDVTRFPNRGHYASFNGTAPIDASSGENVRHRLNRLGNRRINSALHVIAIYQIGHHQAGRVYYDHKLSQGKTPGEARRALKRRLSDVVYRHLTSPPLAQAQAA